MLLHLGIEDRQELFHAYDFVRNGKLNRFEFVTMCKDWLWNVPIDRIELAMGNLQASREGLTKRNRAYWRAVAISVERWARVVIPLSYLLTMVWLFHAEFSDEYLKDIPAELAYLNDHLVSYADDYVKSTPPPVSGVKVNDRGVVIMSTVIAVSIGETSNYKTSHVSGCRVSIKPRLRTFIVYRGRQKRPSPMAPCFRS